MIRTILDQLRTVHAIGAMGDGDSFDHLRAQGVTLGAKGTIDAQPGNAYARAVADELVAMLGIRRRARAVVRAVVRRVRPRARAPRPAPRRAARRAACRSRAPASADGLSSPSSAGSTERRRRARAAGGR
jgi:hypothetical protein